MPGMKKGRLLETRQEGEDMWGRGLVVAVIAAYIAVAVGLLAVAQEATPTKAEYEAAMKQINMTNIDAEGYIDAMYWPEVGDAVGALEKLFARVENFWEARQTEKAAALADEALSAVSTLSQATGAQDQEAARSALQDLRGVCESCHQEFREETTDGYRIKPGV